jgi:succinyl-diaminopimelate desuccinylase
MYDERCAAADPGPSPGSVVSALGVWEQIDEAGLTALARELIRAQSVNPPGNEAAAAEVMARAARDAGLEAMIRPVGEERANAVVRLRGTGTGSAPTLVYCGHLDTVPPGDVPWDRDPFGGEVIDGRIYGRGAADMKGGLAAMLAALMALRGASLQLPGDIVLAALAGEAVDWLGARHFLADGGIDGAGWLVVGEPTNLDLVIGHRGVLWVEATVLGRAAHGSSPATAVNAIAHMAELIRCIDEREPAGPPHPLMPPGSWSVNTIAGGTRTNFIAGTCRATLDVRTVPGQTDLDVIETLRSAAAAAADHRPGLRAEFRVIESHPPVTTDPDHPLIRAASGIVEAATGAPRTVRAVGYYSDAAVLQEQTGVPTLIFGPGDESLGHPVNESVAQSALVAASRFYASLPAELYGG